MKSWAGTDEYRMLVCSLCQSRFFPFSDYQISGCGEEIVHIIKADNLSAFRYEYRGLDVFNRLVRSALRYKSKKIMKLLKGKEDINPTNPYFDYYLDFFLDRSHEGICWALNDFDLPEGFIVTKGNIIELLMQHERYNELSVIYYSAFRLLQHNERVRVGKLLFKSFALQESGRWDSTALGLIAEL